MSNQYITIDVILTSKRHEQHQHLISSKMANYHF